ncbi:uncharacterized protein LOC131690526 [Topomyia yanbarensis]|uniref:uncharacterized protein LOC131690526 n=1 Tax=Topomyia yanbarensis TaxID=2498891 RepID=UPI00273BAD88|nr:uncharacterized protein LOC131690526 [Topomyia yanbarensis]
MEYKLETVTESFEKYRPLHFPLKVWILVNASGGNRILRWNKDKTIILLDRDALEEYLETAKSIFRCSKLATFFWLMDFYGFETVVAESDGSDDEGNDEKHILLYRHDSFTGENRAYFEQLLRSRQLREVISKQHGNCSVHQSKILKNQKQCETGGTTARSQLSSSSFAQEKFNLLMETKSLELSIREAYGNLNIGDDGMVPIIEVPATYCDEPATQVPEYTKQRVIAGNYGQVNLNELKRFFGNYLPVYDDSPEAQRSNEPDEKPPVTPTRSSPVALTKLHKRPDSPRPSTSPPKPVNTLDTFDYNDESTVEQENFEPVDPSEFSPLTPMEDLGFPNDDDSIAPVGSGGNHRHEQLDESQYQLCADIRQTFELLNQF